VSSSGDCGSCGAYNPGAIVYRDADLEALAPALSEAAALWRTRCAEYVAQHGDVGTCVLGAGIAVPYKAPRARTVTYRVMLRPPDTAAQGASTWEASVHEVIALLESRGVHAVYSPGFMD
jgi:hypothetical protein